MLFTAMPPIASLMAVAENLATEMDAVPMHLFGSVSELVGPKTTQLDFLPDVLTCLAKT